MCKAEKRGRERVVENGTAEVMDISNVSHDYELKVLHLTVTQCNPTASFIRKNWDNKSNKSLIVYIRLAFMMTLAMFSAREIVDIRSWLMR